MVKFIYIINIAIFMLFHTYLSAEEKLDIIKKEHEDAVISARQGKYSKAIPALENLIKRYPSNPKYAADLVTVLSWKEDYQLAVKKFEEFLSKNIELPIYAYRAAAISYKRTGSFSKAEEVYKYILENNPKDTDAIREMIFCLLEKKEKEKILNLSEQDAKDSLDKFIDKQLKKLPGSRGIIELAKADFLLKRGFYQEAKAIYSELKTDNRLSPDPEIGLCKIAIFEEDYDLARKILAKIYKKFPKQTEILFCKATLEEKDDDFIGAYKTYLLILAQHPNHQAALNGKYRSLISIGAYSVAQAEIEKDNNKAYEHIKLMLLGDRVSFYVNAEEHRKAVKTATENIEAAEKEYKVNPSEALNFFIIRERTDRIISLRKLFEMKRVLKEYHSLKNEGIDPPFWIVKYAGDAYLYLKKPKKALKLYRQALEMQKGLGFQRPSDTFELKMAIYYALLESEYLIEAGEWIKEIDKETPTYRIQRGLKLKNWFKFEVTLAKGWYLIYENKLPEALEYFNELNEKAAFNSNIRTSLAYTKWFMGWPRKALRDFSVSRTNSPGNTNTEIGYATALNELDEWREARKIAAGLLKKEPKNIYVQGLNRNFYLEEMPVFSAEGSFLSENSFESSGDISLKLEYPIYPKRKIYTETKWLFLSSKEDGLRRTITRSYIGTDWRLNRDLTLIGSASLDYNGENPGFMGGLIYQPTDELTLQGQFDSYSLNLPPKALLNKIKGKETTFIAKYRYSENFFIEGQVDYLRLSDANNEMKYGIRLKQTLTSNAYLKTKLGITSAITTNSKYKDREYYSPRYRANVIAIPEVEILLYRNYDFKILSRSFLGIGPQWEADYGATIVGFIREELDFTINDQLNFLIGTTLSKDTYDGDDSYGWGIDGRLEYIIDYNQLINFFK